MTRIQRRIEPVEESRARDEVRTPGRREHLVASTGVDAHGS